MWMIRAIMVALVLTGMLPGIAPRALAADDDPAACTDQRFNRRIKEQYEFADGIRGTNRKIREQTDIKDIGLGSAPISSLAPRPKDLKITSRYCQSTLVLDNGEKDTLYWRIDVIIEATERSTNFDHCSTRHDTFKDQCVSYRERK